MMATPDPNRPVEPVGPEDEGVGNIPPDEAPGLEPEDEGVGNVRPMPGLSREASQVDAENERMED